MIRVLLDHNVPLPLRKALQDRLRAAVETTVFHDWVELTNGDLLQVAEDSRFDVLVTADQSLRFQQNLAGRRIAVVSVASNRWNEIRAALPRLVEAISTAGQGSVAVVDIGRRAPLRTAGRGKLPS